MPILSISKRGGSTLKLLASLLALVALSTAANAGDIDLGHGTSLHFNDSEWSSYKSTRFFKTELWVVENKNVRELRAFIQSEDAHTASSVSRADASRKI